MIPYKDKRIFGVYRFSTQYMKFHINDLNVKIPIWFESQWHVQLISYDSNKEKRMMNTANYSQICR